MQLPSHVPTLKSISYLGESEITPISDKLCD